MKTIATLRSQHRRASAKLRNQHRSRKLMFESLEPRQVMAASITATLTSEGVLKIIGTDAADKIFLRQIDGKITVNKLAGSWSASQVAKISVQLKGGDDYISFNSIANRGNQVMDEIAVVRSGDGNERVRLASVCDVYFSGVGHVLNIPRNGCVKLDGVLLEGKTNDPPESNAWVNSNIQDTGIRNLANQFLSDGKLNRADMLSIFTQVRQDGTVSSTEFSDLNLLVNNSSFFSGLGYVQVLASNVVEGNSANGQYQGQTLGNLEAGSSGAKLEKLVGKWFLGTDRPVAESDWGPTYNYRQASGSLFVNGAAYTDVRQGGLGDCYLLATFAEFALRTPSTIENMFIVNGDGTYTVRFFHGTTAEYVTVDSYLPTDSSGYFVFASMGSHASNSSNELWVALAEKAYVQMNESNWLRPQAWGGGENVYTGISGGNMYATMTQITGGSVLAYQSLAGTMTAFASAFNSGKSICLGSRTSPGSSTIVGNHAYAVLSVNTSNQTIQVFNPWGLNNGHDDGVITLTWTQVQASFLWYDRTV